MPYSRSATRYAIGLVASLSMIAGLGAGSASAAVPAISVGGAPNGVAVDPSTHAVYVTDSGAPSTISVIDATTTPPSVIPVPNGPSATAYSTYGAAVDPSTHTAYITNGEGLDVINGANPAQPIETQIDSPQLDATYGVAVDPGTHVAWVTNLGVGGFSVGSVTPVAGNPPTAGQPISVGDSPDADAVDPTNHLVYVANKESNTVSVIDGAAAQPSVIHTIDLPGYARDPLSVAVDSSTHTVYVTSRGSGGPNAPAVISVISEAANQVEAYLDDPGGTLNAVPLGVAVDSSTHTVYVANSGLDANDVVMVNGSNPAHPTLTATVPVGYSPNGVAVDPSTHTAYAANGDGTVSVIAPLTITTGSLPEAAVGPYTATLQATGGSTPYTWSATGLPKWLSINPATGIISGTATTGNYQITVTVTSADGLGDATRVFPLTVVIVKQCPGCRV